ncbi:pyridoxamine 5'-phosphate oxidase [Pseudobacteroides cellulosolvens]|uniref:Pyridoxamine 5-phosphate oxidase-related FMN-binding protein n=1 Tax=Pseudobacteroides cellulosolvens ATCC 35603 = DSM 2933 TaxID=398512 RepID=A0A0L6JIN2_9FIRM|nr:pyridoxamine 5'-phosphate oxidase [Pseudobacteroides cellulosolvens]KNY25312.1 pyridoxamine 5-phosphate oxidase-related FMN-binding protein [Pseudobacteroides cellulosolvens ATCC 35603 = DSM 2933]
MSTYEKSLEILSELFSKDYQFALATSNENVPSVRFIDTYYEDCAFYIVTYEKSQKVIEMHGNKKVALCNKLYRFSGTAYILGHPLKDENKNIRSKLIEVFSSWYFKHNNENDENMCYIKIQLDSGFFYKDGIGYKVDFHAKTAEEFPFEFDVFTID